MRDLFTTLRDRLGDLVLRAYRPVVFVDPVRDEPITLEELEQRCGWSQVVTSGLVTATESPLSVARLRTSRLFPRHLLHHNREGKTVLLTETAAVGLVQAELLRRAAALTASRVRSESTDAHEPAPHVARTRRTGIAEHRNADH